jgi:hypothetical protein
LVTGGGLATIAAVVIVLLLGPGTVNGPEAYAVVHNPDGTVTITIKEISAVNALNQRLADLGIRAKAFRADPTCTATVQWLESEWKALDSKIVTENGPAPQITIQPAMIPADATLVLIGQQLVPGRINVLVTLIRRPPPPCMHDVFRLARPPSPGVPPRFP